MTTDKKSFIIYQSWEDGIKLLTMEERGKLLTNLFAYHNNEDVVLDTPMLQMCWNMMVYNLDENLKRYKTYSENGSKGGAPKGNSNAKKKNDDLPKQPKTTKNNQKTNGLNQNNLNDNVNDNVNDNEDVKENVNVSVKDNEITTKLNKLISNKVKGNTLSYQLFEKEFDEYKLSGSELYDLFLLY